MSIDGLKTKNVYKQRAHLGGDLIFLRYQPVGEITSGNSL